tara:strand:+ start:1331 stop:2362 length:1032 start_codon:yes stop_codon:yes gene_type:complete
MPANCESVPKRFYDLIHVVQLKDVMTSRELQNLEQEASKMQWNKEVPGGFIHNTPQRLVNSFGDGSGYNASSTSIGKSWDDAYWTAAVHQSDVTLVTATEKIPMWLQSLGIKCREIAESKYSIKMSDHSFNLAVCNQYITSTHEIAAHTDDNEWYVKDLSDGPMFASLTLYPDSQPVDEDEYARFEVLIDKKWVQLCLPHASVLFMPSCVPHRVRPPLKNQRMHKRMNVTLRSVPSVEIDPFNSLRGVSNHARYYRLPRQMNIAQDKPLDGFVESLRNAFTTCIANNDSKLNFRIVRLSKTSKERKKYRAELTSRMKRAKCLTSCLRGNVVNELMCDVLSVCT